MEHSPLPWTYEYGRQWIFDKDGIGRIPMHPAKASSDDDAEFIVDACNNYEKLQQINKELIEALQKTLDKLIDYAEDDYDAQCNGWGIKDDARDFIGHTRVYAEAILRKAKEVSR